MTDPIPHKTKEKEMTDKPYIGLPDSDHIYNNGKWHGWNGGECPVHPESVVDVRFLDDKPLRSRKAEKWIWDHDGNIGDIIAFRVVKPYTEPRKPRECWMNTASGVTCHDKNAWPESLHDKLILMREVME